MSARMEDLPRLRRRFPRRRRLFVYSALVVIALVIITVLIAFLYIRSERFNRFLAIEIDKALEGYGLRAETERVEPEFGAGAITLRNLKLFNRRTGQLIATIGRASASITIHDPFAFRLRREVVFDRLELDGVDLWVVLDEQGQSNFQGLRRPPALSRRISFDYSKLAGSLSGSAIHFVDRKRDLQGDLRDLAGEGRPIEGSDPPKVGLRLTSGSGSIVHNDHKLAIESIEFIGRVMGSGAEIERLALRSPSLEATASGRVDDWRAPRYQLDMQAWARIEEVLALFTPTGTRTAPVATAPGAISTPPLKGATSFNGRIEGEGARWSAGGQAGSDELVAYGVAIRDAQADRASLELRDGQWTFSIGQARASSVAAEGVDLTTPSASNVKGTIVRGHARITADQATVSSIKTGKAGANEFSGITLRNVSAIYDPDHGKGQGKSHWTFSSSTAQARSVAAGEIRFTDVSASGLNAGVSKGQWTFSTGQAQARTGSAGGVELTNAAASNVEGTVVDGSAQIISGQATVERVMAEQNQFNDITSHDLKATFGINAVKNQPVEWTFSIGQAQARSGIVGTAPGAAATASGAVRDGEIRFTTASVLDVSGTVSGARAQITSKQVTFEHAVTGQGAFNGITLRDVAATLGSGANGAGGLIGFQDGIWERIKFGQTSGRFAANRDAISLSGFNTSAFGGGATGDLTVELALNGPSKLRADFTGLRTSELFALFGAQNNQLSGAITGHADLTWPGTNLRSISGEISARFDGQPASTPDAIPVSGEILARGQSGVFRFDRFTLRTDATTLTATGSLALDGDSDLRFSLTSTRAEELLTILSSTGLAGDQLERLMATYEPHLFGDFNFTGTLSGKLDNPAIAGDLQASSFGLRDEILGSVRGRVRVSPSEVRFEQGSLATDTGGEARFNYDAPRDAAASTGRFDITFERINLDALLASIGLPTQQTLVSGEVSGAAHLTGLPAAPQGEINLTLAGGVIAGQRAESATALIRFDAQTARLERVEARLPQGHFIAGGVINLQTNEYQFHGEARQLGLQRVAEAFELGGFRLGGSADATFQLSGDFNNPEAFSIDMTAQARQVTFGGGEYGPVTLTARTAADGRIDVEMRTGTAGIQQIGPIHPIGPIRASLEWRRPGRPITIMADLADFDIAPFLAAYAPSIAQQVSGRITGNLRVAGPTVGVRGDATVAGLRGAFTLTAITLQAAGTPVVVATPLDIAIGDSQLRIASTRITARGTDLRIGGAIALTENTPIDFSIAGRIDLGAFQRPDDNFNLDGEVMVDAGISGSINDPNVTGAVTMRDISVSAPDAPITLDGGSGRVVLSGNRLTIENFTARAGGGSAQISGGATLTGFKPTEWRFDITANDAEAMWQGVLAAIDADLTLTGTPQGQTLSGHVAIPAAEYASSELSLVELGERGRLRFGSLGGVRGAAHSQMIPPISLDVTVEARESFMIRSNQVNTIASATFRLTGMLSDPEISGRVTFESGAVIFRGQRYDIISGWLELPGGYEEPRLQLQAEGNIRGYRVVISFSGPINSLDLALNSDPPLSRPEIISLITTGSAGTGALNAPDPARAGLTTAGALLSEEFISKTLGRETERFLGLNRFQIDPVLRPYDNPAARITVGRQLARGLSFFYSTNLASEQEQTGVLEYDITRQFSIVSTYTQSGGTQVRAIDQNEFTIDIKGRKRFSLGAGPSATGGSAANPITGAVRPNFRRLAIPPSNLKVGITPSGSRVVKLSEDRLRELLPVREGFSRAQLRAGERNLTDYLQEKGYLFAQVQGRCDPADCNTQSINNLRVFYDVRPGLRYELKEIHIIDADGGAEDLDEHELKPDLQSKESNMLGEIPALKNLPVLGGSPRGKTSNDRMRADRETIRAAMANLGYRSARVESRLYFTTKRDELALIFVVNKGPKSIVSNVFVRGNTMFSASELRELAPISGGETFSADRVREGARRIRDFYAERGHLEARTDVIILDLPGDCLSLIYQVTEGERSVAREVVVTGQTITRSGAIRRFLDFESGDMLTPKLLRNAERDLYATGAFREVIVRATPYAGGAVETRRVGVNVAEADPLSLYYLLGYSTDEGPRATLQFTHSNLFDRLLLGTLRLRGSLEEQLAQIQLTDLRPWGNRWPTTFSAFYQRDSDVRTFVRRRLIDGGVKPSSEGRSFGINRFVGFIQTQRRLGDRMALRFRYSLQNVKLFNLENIPDIEVTRNEPSLRLSEFSTGFTRETRDNVLLPTRGQLFSFDHSLAARELGGNESFNKFFGEYQRYDTPAPLRGTTIAVAARVGLAGIYRLTDRDGDEVISEAERRLPISERFFAGGATTLRGFSFEEAGPQGVLEPRNPNELPTLVPIGGDALVIFNFELRFPLSRRWRLVPFYDLGNVFRRVSDIRFAGMTNSVGLGLRFNTPIGPVGIDYGYLIDPPFFITASGARLRQSRGAFHIRIGQSF